MVDRVAADDWADAVMVDNAGAARLAADHLLGLGHARVLVAASSLALANIRERCDGIAAAFAHAGLDAPEVIEVGLTFDTVAERLEAWLAARGRPSAIIALTNFATLGVLAALSRLGIRVPDDVSLVGFDDYAWMRAAAPSITAVRQPVDRMAEEAWRRLVGRLAGEAGPPLRLRLPCSLEVRASTRAVARPGRTRCASHAGGLRPRQRPVDPLRPLTGRRRHGPPASGAGHQRQQRGKTPMTDAPTTKPNVRLGMHASLWGPSWTREVAEIAVPEAAKYGLQVIEVPSDGPRSGRRRPFRALFEKYGITPTASLCLPFEVTAPHHPEKAEAFLMNALEKATRSAATSSAASPSRRSAGSPARPRPRRNIRTS